MAEHPVSYKDHNADVVLDQDIVAEAESSRDNYHQGKSTRKNTTEEKRRMRNARKRRKRARKHELKELQAEVSQQNKRYKEASDEVKLYKRMSRSYWERWQWELRQRKQELLLRRGPIKSTSDNSIQEIDHHMLTNPEGLSEEEMYVGRGAFGVVKLQLFRGMQVAVKELLPRTNRIDVMQEAGILVKLSHPCIPYLFGVCTTQKPYRIVTQFHGISNSSVTLSHCIAKRSIDDANIWLVLCAQLLEAIEYLHDEVNILHNDLTTSNIIVTDTSFIQTEYQIVVVDFGKATNVEQGRHYHLSECEKAEYTRKFPQLAPEVIEGLVGQTRWSDMFAIGGVLYRIIDNKLFDGMPAGSKSNLVYIARNCRCPVYYKRFSAKKALEHWKLEL